MKAVKKNLKKSLHPVSSEEIKTFFRSQLNNTHHLLSTHNFSEHLHDGRKMLKHLMYNEHVLHDGPGKELNIDFSYVDELQDVLGQWHDNKLSLNFFSNKKIDHKGIDSMKAKNGDLEKAITEKARSFDQKINVGK